MKYIALIYGTHSNAVTQEAEQAEMQAYFAFNDAAGAAGVLVAGESLQPIMTATTVRVRDGKTLMTDGPFAETAEVLGGYYVLECANLDEAITWAARIPGALDGSVEVRPLVTFG